MTTIADIRKMKSELDDKMKTEGRRALGIAFKEFFDANPTVKGVRWSQYTPYFNDGDVCRFSVHDFDFKVDGAADDTGDNEDGWESDWYLEKRGATETAAACSRLEGDVRDRDVFEAVFGDHVRVTATRDGFEVEAYSHN
jgi:hypothetical protein